MYALQVFVNPPSLKTGNNLGKVNFEKPPNSYDVYEIPKGGNRFFEVIYSQPGHEIDGQYSELIVIVTPVENPNTN
jgi:hypothetical protein